MPINIGTRCCGLWQAHGGDGCSNCPSPPDDILTPYIAVAGRPALTVNLMNNYFRALRDEIMTLEPKEPYIAVPDQEDTEAQWRTVNGLTKLSDAEQDKLRSLIADYDSLQVHEKLARLAKIVWSDDPDWPPQPDLLAITRNIARGI